MDPSLNRYHVPRLADAPRANWKEEIRETDKNNYEADYNKYKKAIDDVSLESELVKEFGVYSNFKSQWEQQED